MIKKVFKIAAFIFFIALIVELPQLFSETTAITSYIASIISNNNFHVVIDNRLYRSGEMSNPELKELIKNKGIRTVVNLRLGENEPDKNGVIEQVAVKESGAEYFHVPFRGSEIPSRETVSNLIEVFDKSTTPVLVQCTSGTHRSGVASVIWLLTQEKADPQVAIKQLSSQYGYFYAERWLKSIFQGHPTIDQLIWNYLDAYNKSGITFRNWVQKANSFNRHNSHG